MMTSKGTGHIFVRQESGAHTGLITDADLRSKVICGPEGFESPASSIMSEPLISVSVNEDLLRAMTAMLRYNISRLGVLDESGQRLMGAITEKDILRAQMGSHLRTLHEMRAAGTVRELAFQHEQLPHLVKSLIDRGASAHYLNRFITSFNELVLERLMHFSLRELGPPPARFAFLLLGSEGRQEQTLKTDQDNAIVFEDVPKQNREAVRNYFLELGTRVCDWLHQVGQEYCEFDIMAKNPIWCQPLSVWKKYHRKWIESDDPQGVLHANIFFDFRLGYGQEELVRDLQQSLFRRIGQWPGFLQHMARNASQIKPPLSFFGNFILEEDGEKKGGFDIKSAMRLVVDFARIYALQRGIAETNTTKRLEAMHETGQLDRQNLDDLLHTYEYLMFQRLKHQAENVVRRDSAPDNYILPSKLTNIEQQSLKEAFKRIRTAQSKLRLDFFLHLV
jgi:CBS domain-containing protein